MAKSYQGKRSAQSKRNGSARAEASHRKPKRGSGGDYDYKEKGRKNKDAVPATSSLNDISWYSRYPDLLVAAGNIPYPYRPGMNIKIAPNSTAAFIVPGIVSLNWVPYLGASAQPLDPASLISQEYYTRVRAAYSGDLAVGAPDFMMYLMALDGIFSYLGWLKRIYRIISTYSPQNYQLPAALANACGIIDYTKTATGQNWGTTNVGEFLTVLAAQKINLWQGINELIYMTTKFKCPAAMDIFNRHYWMSDNVYADAPTDRAQFYVFNLRGVYQLDPQVPIADGTGNTAAGLVLREVPKAKAAATLVQDWISFGRQLISALDTWDDGYTISGYLERAFDGMANFAVAPLLQDEKITAVYEPEVLSQIENARSLALPNDTFATVDTSIDGLLTISQDVINNVVVVPNTYKIVTPVALSAQLRADISNAVSLLNIRKDNPMAADTVIATRLHNLISWNPNSNLAVGADVTVTIEAAGTELLTGINMHSVAQQGSSLVTTTPVTTWYYFTAEAGNVDILHLINNLAKLSSFSQHPLQLVWNHAVSGHPISLMTDIDNVTTLAKDALQNLNKVCVYSELNAFNV